jgi:hypothetical protein
MNNFIYILITTISIANADEPMISMYDSKAYPDKVIVECSFEHGQPDIRLLVDKKDQEDFKVVEWMTKNCIK